MYIFCKEPGCELRAENQDTGHCATHGRAARKKATQQAQAETRDKPKPIKQLSKKGQQREAEINKAYKEIAAERPHHCCNCGDQECTHSHILPRGQYGTFAADKRNIVYDCFVCHDIWEHGTLADVEQMSTFKMRLDIIQLLSPIYFFRRFGLILSEYRRDKNV